MQRVFRGALAVFLMILFLAENVVVLAAICEPAVDSASSHSYFQLESQPLFTLLAEENLEGDIKSDFSPALDRVLVTTLYFPSSKKGRIIATRDTLPPLRSLPIYTYTHSLVL